MSHSNMLAARRSKQTAKKQLAKLAKQAKKLKKQKAKTASSGGRV
jgi:hypothetical protein